MVSHYEGGGVKPPEPQKEKLYDLKKEWHEPHETHKKSINKLQIMFSAGQYRSTEKWNEFEGKPSKQILCLLKKCKFLLGKNKKCLECSEIQEYEEKKNQTIFQ